MISLINCNEALVLEHGQRIIPAFLNQDSPEYVVALPNYNTQKLPAGETRYIVALKQPQTDGSWEFYYFVLQSKHFNFKISYDHKIGISDNDACSGDDVHTVGHTYGRTAVVIRPKFQIIKRWEYLGVLNTKNSCRPLGRVSISITSDYKCLLGSIAKFRLTVKVTLPNVGLIARTTGNGTTARSQSSEKDFYACGLEAVIVAFTTKDIYMLRLNRPDLGPATLVVLVDGRSYVKSAITLILLFLNVLGYTGQYQRLPINKAILLSLMLHKRKIPIPCSSFMGDRHAVTFLESLSSDACIVQFFIYSYFYF